MHISDRFVTVCYNIIHCIVFNFVIVIDVLIFTNSPFLFIVSKFTPLFAAYSDPPTPPRIWLYLLS